MRRLFKILLILILLFASVYMARALISFGMEKNGHMLRPPADTRLRAAAGTIESMVEKDREYVAQRLNKDIEGSLSGIAENNASFVIYPEGRRRGIVLLAHGLSDAPYSMRELALRFARSGFKAVCMRLPGHGTDPAYLMDVRWEDWYESFRTYAYAAEKEKAAGEKFILCGFSTGAALCARYMLEENGDCAADLAILFSPAFKVSPFAVITDLHRPLSLFGPFERFAWLDIGRETDPYKYVSFPKNAAYQIYRLTRSNDALKDRYKSERMEYAGPPVMLFQSAFDATVDAFYSLRFFEWVTPDVEMYLYGYNSKNAGLFKKDPQKLMDAILNDKKRTNALLRPYPQNAVWPDNAASLSHLALLFSPGDPVYGTASYKGGMLGEKGFLKGGAEFARIRYNPFFEYMWAKIEKKAASLYVCSE